MCRYKTEEGERKVYGVLMDFDLSSWTAALNGEYKITSQQRTGTPPYMAQELLKGTSPKHLYRHDLESLFYVMLLTTTRHTIGIPKGWSKPRLVMREVSEPKELPFYYWFDQCNYYLLGSSKASFLLDEAPIDLSSDFQDFREWLKVLQNRFAEGFKSRPSTQDLPDWGINKPPAANGFDEETLGGNITYGAVIKAAPYLAGKLKGLLVRYPDSDSENPPVS